MAAGVALVIISRCVRRAFSLSCQPSTAILSKRARFEGLVIFDAEDRRVPLGLAIVS